MNNNELYRVYNTCKYDIGVKFPDGRQYNIKPGSFALLDANDIAMIENECQNDRFVSTGKLVPKDEKDNPVDIQALFRIVKQEDTQTHYNDDDIRAKLSQPVKKIEAWLETVEDPAEKHAVWDVATKMDLPASKLKILNAKIPNKEWLE